MMELMNTKLDKEIKPMMFPVKPIVLVQALELWMILLLQWHLFERLMINRMDGLAYDQRNHHELFVARFQNLDEQIEDVQNQLFELRYRKEDRGI